MLSTESDLRQQVLTTEVALLKQRIFESQVNMRMTLNLWRAVNKKAIANQQKCDRLTTEIAVKDALIENLKERLNELS